MCNHNGQKHSLRTCHHTPHEGKSHMSGLRHQNALTLVCCAFLAYLARHSSTSHEGGAGAMCFLVLAPFQNPLATLGTQSKS